MSMTEQPTPSLHTDTTDPLHDSPGRQLRVARETANITLAQVASELHLSTSTIVALEDDHYEGLPSEVFVIGYLRGYARLVGVDPVPLLERYRGMQPSGLLNPVPALSKYRSKEKPSLALPMWWVVVALSLVVLIAGWLWWAELGGDAFFASLSLEPTAEDGIMLTPARSAPQPVLPRLPADMSLTDQDTQGGVTEQRLSSEQGAETEANAPDAPPLDAEELTSLHGRNAGPDEDLASAPPEDAASPSASADPDQNESAGTANVDRQASQSEVVMVFKGPCWVDVRDATGEFKLFGEMNKGDRRVLGGQPPYSIILGNATAVELTVNGKPFDVEAVARGNVARFDLDPASL